MSLHRRGASRIWHVEFEVAGRKVRRSTRTEDRTKALALEVKWRQEATEEHHHGVLPPISLQEAVTMYQTEEVAPRSPTNLASTAVTLGYKVGVVVQHFGPDTMMQDITEAAISGWRSKLMAKGLAPATVNGYLAMIGALLRTAKIAGRLRVLPKMRRVVNKAKKERVMTDEEETRLLAIADPDLADLIVFLVDTGARRGDALQLAWADIRDGQAIFTHTKTDRHRRVPLTSRVRVMLARRKAAGWRTPFPWCPNTLMHEKGAPKTHGRPGQLTPAHLDPPGVEKLPNGRGFYVWICAKGALYRIGHYTDREKAVAARRAAERVHFADSPRPGLHQAWQMALRRSGIMKLTVHDLRHTCASRLISDGVPIVDVKELLGHASIVTTMRYVHLAPARLGGVVAALERRAAAGAGLHPEQDGAAV